MHQWNHPVGRYVPSSFGDVEVCPPCEGYDRTLVHVVGGLMLLGIVGTAVFLAAEGGGSKQKALSYGERNLERTARV